MTSAAERLDAMTTCPWFAGAEPLVDRALHWRVEVLEQHLEAVDEPIPALDTVHRQLRDALARADHTRLGTAAFDLRDVFIDLAMLSDDEDDDGQHARDFDKLCFDLYRLANRARTDSVTVSDVYSAARDHAGHGLVDTTARLVADAGRPVSPDHLRRLARVADATGA